MRGLPETPEGPWKVVQTEIPLLATDQGEEMATQTAHATAPTGGAVGHLQVDDRIWLLRAMLLMRGIELYLNFN